MKRFVEGDERKQVALLPECVDDYIGPDNPVRIIDVFVDELNLRNSVSMVLRLPSRAASRTTRA
jgi:transposase